MKKTANGENTQLIPCYSAIFMEEIGYLDDQLEPDCSTLWASRNWQDEPMV